MEENMKEIGIMIRDKEEDLNYIKIKIHIRVNFRMEKLMGMVSINGLMVKNTRDNGLMVLEMAKEFGKELKAMYI
jgi:hypothetical protein